MAAVFGAAEHLAEFGPLVVPGMLYEGGDGGVEADEAAAINDEVHERLFQFGVVEEHALRVVETDSIELADLIGTEHFDIVAEDYFIGSGAFAHLLDGIVAGGDGGVAANDAVAGLREVGDQEVAGLLRFGRRLFREGGLDLLFLLRRELWLLPADEGGAESGSGE